MSAQLTVAVDDMEIATFLSQEPESFLAVITALADEERHWEFALLVAKESGGSKAEEAVTEVRVQRLQEISEADAVAEGIEQAKSGRFFDPSMSKGAAAHLGGMHHCAMDAYASLWASLHGPGSWEANPWVMAVSFDMRKGNIDGQ